MQRHSVDALSLVFGLLFTAVAAVGLTDQLTLTVIDVRWIGPVLLVAIGIALVVTAGRNRNGKSDTASDVAVATVGPTRAAADPLDPANDPLDPADDPLDPADDRDDPTADTATDR